MGEISAHDLILGLVVLVNGLLAWLATDALGRIKKIEEGYMTREEIEDRRAELRNEFMAAIVQMRDDFKGAFSIIRQDMRADLQELKADIREHGSRQKAG